MDRPTLFAEQRPEVLHRWMHEYPLATLIVGAAAGPAAYQLPLQLVSGGSEGAAVLRGHTARTHPFTADAAAGDDLLVLFHGPQAYISPRWYVNGQRSGRLAPSWNYLAAQARGTLRYVDDAAWLRRHLGELTDSQERDRPAPWRLGDAAADFVDSALQRLIGFEIAITALQGRSFLSQQRTEADRRSVIAHLEREPAGAARELARWIEP